MPTRTAHAGALAGLNRQQRAAAEAATGPLCILAGAGTGKTRTITHRIAHQVASGVARAEQVLAVTFTDKAARELRDRLGRLGIERPVRAATFHAAAWAQLRFFWPRLHHEPIPGVLASKIRLLVPAARRLRVEPADLAAEIEWAKARRLSPEGYRGAAGRRHGPLDPEQMAAVYARYEADKADAGLIDYDDMILLTQRMLDEHADVAAQVRDRYRFFTVDEFQDVNPAQYALLRAWLGPSEELCVVGDDDQSIYGFTGATPDYLVGFRRDFPRARVLTLTHNYRSTREVLALANRVLWTKPAARRKRLTSEPGARRPRPGPGSGSPPPAPDRRDGSPSPAVASAPDPAPVFHQFASAEDETDAVVARVRELTAEGVPPGEIAVCYRINSQSEVFEHALRAAGIAYLVRGPGGFFDRREIRQALAALRAAAARGTAPEPAAPGVPSGPPGTRPAGPPRPERQVEQILRDQLSWHPRREPGGQAARERWRNLGELVELAGRLAADRPGLDLAGLVAALSERAADAPETAADAGAVELLTLHRAKGLEFDAVFIVGCEEGLLPISHAQTDAEVEEERRLLYVGVTRARRHLWLSWALSRPGRRGTPVSRRPSRLLYNLGPGAPQSGAPGRRPPAAPPSPPGPRPPATPSPSDPRPPATPAAPPSPRVVEQLRAWRAERARRDAVPAYVIFNDRTLAELAARRPGSQRELLAVHGFGRVKVERYGEEVLHTLRQTPS